MNQNSNKAIFLCGMMGTGKSLIGKHVARKLNLPFTDLDSKIESETGKKIPQIFEEKGESGFREIEKKSLINYLKHPKGVLALGGGSLQNQELVNLIKNSGILIYIDTPNEILLSRLKKSRRRPMINGLDTDELKIMIEKLLEERKPFYNQANIIISGASKNYEITTKLIIQELTK
ncbi:MAG: shikimate kinase [Candidatus Paceibacterota bacterium]